MSKLLYPMDELEAMEFLLDKIKATKNNADFFDLPSAELSKDKCQYHAGRILLHPGMG